MTVMNSSLMMSTDTGAVSGSNGRCSGTAGDGVLLLNQILLNGYNWQAVTAANLTRSGTTASLTLTAHGFRNTITTIAVPQRLCLVGADQTGYNVDTIYPTWVDANTITYTVAGSPATPATAGGSTTLNGAIASTTATSITVTANASFPGTNNFTIKIDTEAMLVTAGAGTNTWTVRRGVCGTTAATHSNGATVTQTIYIGVAPAGGFLTPWTGDFTAASKSTYRPPSGNRFYFDADDTQAQYCRMRGYETMTAVATGTGLFPTVAQIAVDASGVNMCRSSAASTVARAWIALVSDRFVYVWIDYSNGGVIAPAAAEMFCFGDLIYASKSGDAYHTLFAGTPSAGGVTSRWQLCTVSSSVGHYLPRSYTQAGTSINVGKSCIDVRLGIQTTGLGGGVFTYPYPMDGGLYLCPIGIAESAGLGARGILPGQWFLGHALANFNHLDTWNGTGTYAGKTFMAVLLGTSGGMAVLEVSNTIPLI